MTNQELRDALAHEREANVEGGAAAYAEKWANAERMCADALQQRDEARAKLAASQALAAKLQAALKPFAEAAKHWVDAPGTVTHDNVQLWQRGGLVDYLTCGDLRAAKAALAATPAAALEAVGAERAARELRAVADGLWRTAETFIEATHPGWRNALKAASERCHSRAAELDREGKCGK